MKKDNFRVGFAFGGGGMCGVAHIGFLEVLEENNIPIDVISGISMGAIVGGFFASGLKAKEMENLVLKLAKNDIIEVNFFRLLKESLLTSRKIKGVIESNLVEKNIENAKIKFYAGACNLETGKLEYFESGLFSDAMLCSSAIPGIFPPVGKDNKIFVDGGVVENVPFNKLKEEKVDVIFAIDCLGEYKKNKISSNTFSYLTSSFEVMQKILIENNKTLNKENFDLYIYDSTDGVNHIDTDFKLIPKLIESGRRSAEQNLEEIKKIIKKKKNLAKNAWFL